MKTWNYERWRTRDRLLEVISDPLPYPYTDPFPFIYPCLSKKLWQLPVKIIEIAKNSGYIGTEENFWNYFSPNSFCHFYPSANNFPELGIVGDLYFDNSTNELYYFQVTTKQVLIELTAKVGEAIIGTHKTANYEDMPVYIYVPISALSEN